MNCYPVLLKTLLGTTMTETITLPDRRTLAFLQSGDPAGKPVLFFHGSPGSRLLHHPDDSLTAALGVRLITIDRPGFGGSDYQPNRKLLDWPSDVTALVDKLGIKKFAVAGVSGGSPYVAACAYKLSDRLTVGGIISGVGPTDVAENVARIYKTRKGGIFLARHAPWLLRPLIWLLQNPQRGIEKYYLKILAESSFVDQEILRRPEIKSLVMASWNEGTINGMRGFTRDGIIFSLPWGFQLEDIRVKIHIWHGDKDTSTPLCMAKHLASLIRDCQLTVIPGKGHFLLFDHWSEILTTLIKP
jgi:pimeloyl-ACP methyl ester carboxylesterase